VKLCSPRTSTANIRQQMQQPQRPKSKGENCKVFVGGLPQGIIDEDMKRFFSRYGQVSEQKKINKNIVSPFYIFLKITLPS
jgi:RNA recognition motif-containing protein